MINFIGWLLEVICQSHTLHVMYTSHFSSQVKISKICFYLGGGLTNQFGKQINPVQRLDFKFLDALAFLGSVLESESVGDSCF